MALRMRRKFLVAATVAGVLGAGLNHQANAQGTLVRTINNPVPAIADNFGRNLMVTSDGMILAGAQGDVGSVSNAGIGYLINATSGAVIHTFPNPEPDSNVGYSAFSWAGDNYVVFSAFGKDDGANNESGRAYVFNKSTGQLVKTLLNPTPGEVDQFGYGVGMLGDNVILGARGDDAAGADTGTVYLFDASSGNLLRTIPNPEPTATDNFGYSVAGIGTDRILVGAPGTTVGGKTAAGKAYLLNANTGAVIHEFENPYPIKDGFFGFQVRAHGEDLLIGSPNNNKAYLYDGDTGQLIHQFDNPNVKPGAVFGSTVASVANNVIIGNPHEPGPGGEVQIGKAYVFNADTGALRLTLQNPTPQAEDRFGVSVAGWNGRLVVSADQNTVSGVRYTGSIYIFEAPPAAACCEWNLYE